MNSTKTTEQINPNSKGINKKSISEILEIFNSEDLKIIESVKRVLPNLEGPSYQTYFVYPESFKNDRRLEVFRDFLFNEAKDLHY